MIVMLSISTGKICSTKFKNVFLFFYLEIQSKKTFFGGNLLACIFDRLR